MYNEDVIMLATQTCFSPCSRQEYTVYRRHGYTICCPGYGSSNCHGMNIYLVILT